LDLENENRYQGLGKALYLIAEIYAHPALNYFSFSEESFLKIANFLGNNTELADRININGFPEQVKSLLHTKIATAKNMVEYKKIYFNHDVLAEEGVIYANNIYSELKLELELFDLKKLFEYLAEQCDLTGSLMLWLWLYTIKLKNNTGGDELLAIIRKELNLIPSSLLVYIIKNKVTSEFKKKICKYILEQDAFFKLPHPIVSTALKILQNEETGQTAAKTILEQKAFIKLPFEIVSTALKILQNEETGKNAAKTILKRGFRLPTFLLFNAIKVLSNSEEDADKHLTEIFVKDIYDKIKYPQKTKGFVRLYYDLLYISLMDIPAHRKRVFNIIKSYKPKSVRNKKYNIFKVLKCYSDYPDIKYYKTEIINLCKRILEKWYEDVQYQVAKNPHELIFGHIDLAFSFAEPKELSLKAAKEIVSYGGIDKNFKQSQLYKTAMDIINTVEFT